MNAGGRDVQSLNLDDYHQIKKFPIQEVKRTREIDYGIENSALKATTLLAKREDIS